MYRITNTISGLVLGVYEGDTPEAALLAMHRDAGYDSSEAAEEVAPTVPGELRVEEVIPAEIGARVGRAMARDVLAEDLTPEERRQWTGLDDQDGDQLTAAGLEPDTPAWEEAEAAAKAAYLAAVSGQEVRG